MNKILKIVAGVACVTFACRTGVRATESSTNDLRAAYAERMEFLERYSDIVKDPQNDMFLQYVQTLSGDLSRPAFKEHLKQSLEEDAEAFIKVWKVWPFCMKLSWNGEDFTTSSPRGVWYLPEFTKKDKSLNRGIWLLEGFFS